MYCEICGINEDRFVCAQCEAEAKEYDNANGARTLMRSRVAFLFKYDVDALDDDVHQAIRPNVLEDAEVKRLYHMYKSL